MKKLPDDMSSGSIYVPSYVWKGLATMAQRRDISRTELTRRILTDYIRRHMVLREEDEPKAWDIFNKRRNK